MSDSERVNVNLVRCARCGGDHTGLVFKRFRRPIVLDKDIYTHWALCPVTQEPIIMLQVYKLSS